jgi:hypothetical protein
MRCTKIILMTLLPLIVLSSCCLSRKTVGFIKPTDEELQANYVKVLDVLKTIQYAVEKAYLTDPGYSMKPPKEDPDNALNHLSELSIELSNSLSKSVGGEVSFWVVKAGGSHAREKASSFTYTFSPIKDEAKIKERVLDEKNAILDERSKELQAALVSLGTCLKKYENEAYDLDKLELAVSFKITNAVSAGLDFKIGVVGITPEGELEWGNENAMTLTFEIKEERKKDETASN